MAGVFKNKFKYFPGDIAPGCIQKTGNFYSIGVNPSLDYGPTSSTGFWNAVSAQTAGQLASYQFKGANYSDQGPSIYVGDASTFYEYVNEMGIGTFTDTPEALSYIARLKTDIVVTNITYPAVELNGLRLLLDAGYTASYPWQDGVWYDLSGFGYRGTLSGGTTWLSAGTDYASSYMFFSGGAQSQNIQVENFGTALGYFTVQVWVNFRTLSTSDEVNIVSQVPQGQSNSNFFITLSTNSPGQVIGGVKSGGTTTSVVIDPTPPTNNWVLYTLTYDGNELKGFVNNSQTNATALIGATLVNNGQVTIVGGTTNNTINNGSSNYFDGKIGLVAIYQNALDLSFIESNYNKYVTRY